MKRATAVALALACSLALLAACGDGDAGPTATPGPTASPTPTYVLPSPVAAACPKIDDEFPQAVVAKIEAGGVEFQQGDLIDVKIRLLNCARSEITRTYATAQRYDLSVSGPDGELWRWSTGQTFAQEESEETYQSGDEVDYKFTWDQTDQDGNPVPPGEYDMLAEITSCNESGQNCGPTALLVLTIVE